jgi:hypothetical protein
VELKNQPGEEIVEGFAWFDCGTGGSQTVKILR